MNEERITYVGADPQISPENGGSMRASTPTEKERTPEMIGAEIRMYVDAGRRITLLCGIEIGRRLVEAKEMLNHGEWLPWLKRETEFSERSAQNYMKVFNEYGAAQLGLFGPETNTQTFADLPISKALAMLSLPESERESFAEEVGAEALSVRDLEALVKERTAELERKAQRWEDQAGSYASQVNDLQNDVRDLQTDLEDAVEKREREEKARAEAEEQLQRIKQELEEIENRPQAVAYERDELAIAEEVEAALQIERESAEKEKNRAIKDAVQAEREELKKERGKLKAKIAELEEQVKKSAENLRTAHDDIRKAKEDARDAREAVQRAQQAEAETEDLQRQIETLKKQLALAAPSVAAFKAAFDRAQDELVHMELALREIQDEEIKEKLKKASLAMLDGVMERVKG